MLLFLMMMMMMMMMMMIIIIMMMMIMMMISVVCVGSCEVVFDIFNETVSSLTLTLTLFGI